VEKVMAIEQLFNNNNNMISPEAPFSKEAQLFDHL
jgi:hypothetical protein